MSKSVVVLISGAGSNLQAIIDHAKQDKSIQIVGVISNRSNAQGLLRAQQAGIPTSVIDHQAFTERELFDAELIKKIDSWQADLVVLAGFMRILTQGFVSHYKGRLLNIHPSLLPKFKGTNTHIRALEAKEIEHGCTVHFVTAELDGGAPIINAAIPVLKSDTPDSLQAKIHQLEHQIYPIAVSWFTSGRLIERQGKAVLDNVPIDPCGYRFTG